MGPRFDHLGFWAQEIDADKRDLVGRGAPLDFDATTFGRLFTYHRLDSIGARAELVDRTLQAGFIETWAPNAAPMAPRRADASAPAAHPIPAPGTSTDGVLNCRATLIDFLAAIDHGRATDALDLFTPDASFAARGQQLRGREPIASFLREREAETDRYTVHVVTNEIVRSATEDEVVLSALVLLHERASDGKYGIERVLDTTQTFRRDRDRWRISHRSTKPLHPPSGR